MDVEKLHQLNNYKLMVYILQMNYSAICQIMEQIWVANWFNRLLGLREQMTENEQLIIADRSPFSAIYYSKCSRYEQILLEKLIRDCILELQNSVRDQNVLLNRIKQRLLKEPFRAQYNEDDPYFLQQTIDFYDSIDWDWIVYNDNPGYNDDQGLHTEQLLNTFTSFAIKAQGSW